MTGSTGSGPESPMTPTIPKIQRALKEVKIFYLICPSRLLFKWEERGEKIPYYLKKIFLNFPWPREEEGILLASRFI
jgi:hypothetical protein